jgi:signal transduction histidine kinase
MVCRKFYVHVLARIMLILLNSLLLAWLVFRLPNISLVIIAACLAAWQSYLLVRYVNRVNVKIGNFFQAHLSGEVTSSFTRPKKSDEFSVMYDYFGQLNSRLEGIRVEHEVRNNYFRTIADQTSVGLISFTDDGEVDFINDAAKRIFKVFVVRNLSRFDTFRAGFSRYLADLEPEKTELVPVTVDDEVIQLSVKKINFRAGDRSLHLVSLQNIKAELDQKEIESWQRLIRVLTHEIMNSITPITSLVNTISRIYKDRETGTIMKPDDITAKDIEKTVQGLDIVEGRGARLIQFVNNYRDLTKLPKPVMQPEFIKPIFQEILGLHQDLIKMQNVKVVVACHPSLQVTADRRLLEQVLVNLFKNAVEACAGKPAPVVRLSALASGESVTIEVEDNGRGIPPEVEMNMFVPFFTTKEKGSGIGLSLSRQLIRLHGGNLDFYSVPGEKTIFSIRL